MKHCKSTCILTMLGKLYVAVLTSNGWIFKKTADVSLELVHKERVKHTCNFELLLLHYYLNKTIYQNNFQFISLSSIKLISSYLIMVIYLFCKERKTPDQVFFVSLHLFLLVSLHFRNRFLTQAHHRKWLHQRTLQFLVDENEVQFSIGDCSVPNYNLKFI